MKTIIFTALVIIISLPLKSQSYIVKKDNSTLKVEIVEIQGEFIKYYLYDDNNKILRSIKLMDISKIIFPSGEIETFNSDDSKNTHTQPVINNSVTSDYIYEDPDIENIGSNNNTDKNYQIIALGYGNSYGGIGVQYAWRINGFGMQGGLGYFPVGENFMGSFGLRFYIGENMYLSVQYGGTGWEEYYLYSSYGSYYEGHQLNGASFMLEGEWIGKSGFGLNLGIGWTHNSNVEYFPEFENTIALDIALVFKF